MKLGISASITSINSISFVDKDGQPITDNVKYTFDKDSLKESNISYQNTEVDVEFFNGKEQPTYALIQGKGSEGNCIIHFLEWPTGCPDQITLA